MSDKPKSSKWDDGFVHDSKNLDAPGEVVWGGEAERLGIPHPKTWPPVEKQPARDADLLSNEEADDAKKAGASVQRAIAYAFSAQAGRVRKGTSIPYVRQDSGGRHK